MSKVSVYMENVFAGLPNTAEAKQLQQEMTANLEEQYETARQSGMSENEALGTVVSGFGSVDELKEILGVAQEESYASQAANQDQQYFAMQWVDNYMAFKERFAKNLTLGIVICILALVVALVLDEIGFEMLSGAAFLGMVAIGAGIIIYNALQHDKYSKMLKMFGMDESGAWIAPKAQPTEVKQRNQELAKRITAVIWPLATLYFFVASFVFHQWGSSWIVFPIAGVLSATINGALGVPDEEE